MIRKEIFPKNAIKKKKNDKKISKDVNKIDIKLYDFDAQN